MTIEKAEIDVIRRVYAPFADGQFIELRPWPDSPKDTLELITDGANAEYFGQIHLSMNLDFAEALGRALLASVKDLRDECLPQEEGR